MQRIVVTQHPGVVRWLCSTPRARTFLVAAATLLLLLSAPSATFAGSATWLSAPATSDWNTAGNWTAGGPPNGPADTAFFGGSNRTAVSISANTQVNGIQFNGFGSFFTITANPPFTLTISGLGIFTGPRPTHVAQNFVTTADGAGNHASIVFNNSATVGGLNRALFTNNGGLVSGLFTSGNTIFNNTSSAGNAGFTNNGGTVSGANGGATEFEDTSTAARGYFYNNGGAASGAFGGFTSFSQFSNNTSTAGSGRFNNKSGAVPGANGGQTAFFGSSTAANGLFTNDGSAFSGPGQGFVVFHGTSTAANGIFTNNSGTVSGARGGVTRFLNSSTAGAATLIANGGTVSGARGGVTRFLNNSTAGAATLIAKGGTGVGVGGIIFFQDDSTGGTARVKVFGNGSLDISRQNTPGVTIGSIEGSGNVFLGANDLTVGSNNLSETLSGVIQDGGFNGGTGGSLTKIGAGTLSLTNLNPYTGGTLINAGTLIAAHDGALGAGNVRLTAGATLTVQGGATNNYISDNSSINIANGATANLNFTGASDRVGGIVLNGVMQTAEGTYGSASSGATFQSAFFSGTGTLVLGTATPTVLDNISTRLRVETGDNVLIGGFIITGTQPKKVIVRAIGPSLQTNGAPVAGRLENPTLELFGPSGKITSNDNWQDSPNKQAIIDSTVPPSNDLESAIVATLPANATAYTAVVRGAGGGTGIGLVEVYDLDRSVDSKLANISGRGFVQTGDDIMIEGFIISGASSKKVIVRAIGPSLTVPGKLANPTLELFNKDGVRIVTNDNWRSNQEAEIIASTVPPTNDLESAIVAILPPTEHTAIVRGNGGTTGVALVEVYSLD